MVVIDIGETFGGMMVGLLLASLMCGIASVQAFIFFRTKQSDPLLHKITVGLLWLLDVIQLCFVFDATYYYVITLEDNILPPFVWSLKIQIFMQTLIMGLTKLLYTLRIWQLRQYISKWIPFGLLVFLTADYAMGIVFTYEVFTVDLLTDLLTIRFKPIAIASMSMTSVSDFLVAGLLIYTLAKSKTNLTWTDSSWEMVIAYVVNTGIITGFISAAVVIAFAIGVQKPAYIGTEMGLPQFYVNCFLSMMNASVYFKTPPASRRTAKPITRILSFFHDEDSGSSTAIISGSDRDVPSSPPIIVKTLEADSDAPTINEIGLPLLKFDAKPEPVYRNVPLEVVVRKTQHVMSSEIRRGHTF
ncbi:hypothetical protein GYMLUDRAFT_920070 [Collybiopsis luxurians FD-317 M1]|uniref:DUF6534 domain-containing protein n=1 Tax=Collybiopsis luxurians FD-317 M1 TaxID=944289 RepID=A0A0D0CGM9_9AGAR|nr:hypothetical protein GYMLUDRAFT_920070 [Collybiopsis luxurians FD-317 M1]